MQEKRAVNLIEKEEDILCFEQTCIDAIHAFMRVSDELIFVRDSSSNTYKFLDGKLLHFSGYSRDELLDMQEDIFHCLIPDEDKAFLQEHESKFYDFVRNLEPSRRKHAMLIQTYSYIHKDGSLIPANVALTPLSLDCNNQIWLLVGKGSFSHKLNTKDAYICMVDDNQRYVFDRAKQAFIHKDCAYITPIERTVLVFSARGYTENEVAEELKLSKNTVKSHKANIYKKLEVNNIAEAYTVALNHNLLN